MATNYYVDTKPRSDNERLVLSSFRVPAHLVFEGIFPVEPATLEAIERNLVHDVDVCESCGLCLKCEGDTECLGTGDVKLEPGPHTLTLDRLRYFELAGYGPFGEEE